MAGNLKIILKLDNLFCNIFPISTSKAGHENLWLSFIFPLLNKGAINQTVNANFQYAPTKILSCE